MEILVYLIINTGISFLIATIGSDRKVGYWGGFWWSFFFGGIIGLIIILCSDTKDYVKISSSKAMDTALIHYKNKDYKAALQYAKESHNISPTDININFNLACLYSLNNNNELSILHLDKAVQLGYSKFDNILNTDDLAGLRSDPAFNEFKAKGFSLR